MNVYRENAFKEPKTVTHLKSFLVGMVGIVFSVVVTAVTAYYCGRSHVPDPVLPPEPCIAWVEIIDHSDQQKHCKGRIESTIYGTMNSVLVKCTCGEPVIEYPRD